MRSYRSVIIKNMRRRSALAAEERRQVKILVNDGESPDLAKEVVALADDRSIAKRVQDFAGSIGKIRQSKPLSPKGTVSEHNKKRNADSG